MLKRSVALNDKYNLNESLVLVTGYQALVRLTLMQHERDRRAGLHTAGYITGYRGSPLGGLDGQFQRASGVLAPRNILLKTGLNEDLAATALWGSQQAELQGEGRYDGVFGMWYGKGPGVDRSGDAFRHANFAGTSKHGGVLALMGDDHTAESSTTAHQSEFQFADVMTPTLNPAGVQEIVDYGLYGWAMSRYAGVWVGLKCMHEIVESTAVIDADIDRLQIIVPGPEEFCLPPGGLNIRRQDTVLGMEARLLEFKRDAILAFISANRLNKLVFSGGATPRIGVVTTGKSYLDVRQALDELQIDETMANHWGIRLLKVGCSWPIAKSDLSKFADGLDLIVVVEEKRSLIEAQLREELYGSANQPICIGKKDEYGNWLFPAKGALDPNDIAICIGDRIAKYANDAGLSARVEALRRAQAHVGEMRDLAIRMPHFCSGCPHNSSTVVPEGAVAYAGIGCHGMAQWMDRSTLPFTQMGGEGANWIGLAPFSKRKHVFQNLGDGTYNHSGSLAIRAAIAAGVNVTFKILFNDAVAMTGGQLNDGDLTVWGIANQVAAEGARRVIVVSDEPGKYPSIITWPDGLTFHHRDELQKVQRELSLIEGCTVLIYDQTCAAEKRRRRKRGTYPDPDKRVIINKLVCEGCGDCGVQSNCISIQPLETEFGRKRTIDQSSCNKDFSCVKGFCPSFVTVHGAKLRKQTGHVLKARVLEIREPERRAIDGTFNVVITGVGGTGIVTIGGILAMAAHLDGKGVGVIDMAGLAQKGGAVYSHLRIAELPEDIHAVRVAAGGANLVLGGDLVVTASKKVLASAKRGTTIIVNQNVSLPGEFTRNADFSLPVAQMRRVIETEVGSEHCHFLEASRLAASLLGNTLGSNIFLVGFAYQLGCLPLSSEAIEAAIALNGEAVEMNRTAFYWGRRAAINRSEIEELVEPQDAERNEAASLQNQVDCRADFLKAYQNAGYSERYRRIVERISAAEQRVVPDADALSAAVAKYLFKLMAYKDEYEVARLYTDGSFIRQLHEQFDSDGIRLEFHLAPPLFARKDAETGRLQKSSYGQWMFAAFRVLAKLKGLRGTLFDPFGYSHERRTERKLIADYELMLDEIIAGLTPANYPAAIALAEIPEKIRGFGYVKEKNVTVAIAEQAAMLEGFRTQKRPALRAAE
jgi:indolepyruvate ferredoxin oxidoreductase